MAQDYYTPEQLEKLHELELQILRDFVKVCEENNLTYFGMAGTALGAVRHKGYIPWDDDIDIAIPRKDFDVLIKIFEKEYADKYYILNTEHNPNYPLPTTRICIKGTKFVEKYFVDIDCDFGVFLDVFPYDNLADNKFERFWQLWIAWFWGKLLILRSIKSPYLAIGGLGGKVLKCIFAMVHYTLKFFHVPKTWIYKQCKRVCTGYNDRKTRLIGFPCDTSPHWDTISRKQLFPLVDMEFEGMMIKFPRDTKHVLVSNYGPDYMKLPPVEKRKTHFPRFLDLGDGKLIEGKR